MGSSFIETGKSVGELGFWKGGQKLSFNHVEFVLFMSSSSGNKCSAGNWIYKQISGERPGLEIHILESLLSRQHLSPEIG